MNWLGIFEMAHLLTGKDEMLKAWAARRIEHIGSPEKFGPSVAVGVMTGPEPTDRLMAVVVFHEFYPNYAHCQISAAGVDPRWASRSTMRGLLAVPFIQYECNKVWTATPHTSERVIRFNQAIGFTKEAVLKDHFGRGQHAVICRMMAKDYDRRYFANRAKAA